MTTTTRSRAAIYARISRDQRDDRLGVERQTRLCEGICRERGWTVEAAFEDNDISATEGRRRRPGFEKLLTGTREGLFDVVVAVDLDRLVRSHRDLLRLVESCTEHGVRVAFQSEAGFDPVTGDGMMEIEVRTSVAAEEIRKLRRRVRRKRQEQAERGLPNNGMRPYGWESSQRKRRRPREIRVLRGMVDRLLAGASQGDIVRWLNDGVKAPTAYGRRWTVARVRRTLLAPGLAGLREVRNSRGEVVDTVKATWKGVITPEERARIVAVLSNVRRHRAPSQYLLSGGLLICGRCGSPMVGAGDREHRRYRCPQLGTMVSRPVDGCGRVSHLRDTLEGYVVSFALHWAITPEVVRSRRAEADAVASEASKVRERLAALRLKEERLNDMRVDGDISPPEHRRKMSDLTREREHLERQLGRVQSAEDALTEAGGFEECRRRWDTLTHNERRAVLRSLLVEVKVMPGVPGRNTFDPRRVHIAPDWQPLLDLADSVDPAELTDELQAQVLAEWSGEP